MSTSEFQAPVATLTEVEKNGKTLESYFVSGEAYILSVRGENPFDELITRVDGEDQTIVVTVAGEAGNRKYLFDGQETPNFNFIAGGTITFDVSDPSNEGPLKI